MWVRVVVRVVCLALALVGRLAFAESAFELGRGERVLAPLQYRQLAVFPIVEEAGALVDTTQYLTLAEGLASHQVTVRESEGGGNVNRVMLANHSDRPLLLLGGEIILGGQQDRILGKDTLVPAGERRALEVFCVEHGRWSGGRAFTSAGGMVETKTRAKAKYDSNQGQVWAEVAKKTSALGASSSTGTYRTVATGAEGAQVVKPFREHLGAKLAALPEAKRMIGLVAAVNGRIVSVERFASARLFAAYRDRLLDALFVSAADAPAAAPLPPPGRRELSDFLGAADAAPERTVLDGAAARTVEKQSKTVKKSQVIFKTAPASAKPIYESYQADD